MYIFGGISQIYVTIAVSALCFHIFQVRLKNGILKGTPEEHSVLATAEGTTVTRSFPLKLKGRGRSWKNENSIL